MVKEFYSTNRIGVIANQFILDPCEFFFIPDYLYSIDIDGKDGRSILFRLDFNFVYINNQTNFHSENLQIDTKVYPKPSLKYVLQSYDNEALTKLSDWTEEMVLKYG